MSDHTTAEVGQAVRGAGTAPLSKSLRRAGLIFVSGMVPIDDKGNLVADTVEQQTRFVLESMRRELQSHGADLNDVVKCTALLADPARDWAQMNSVYREYFNEPFPTRSAFGVVLAAPGLLVEIEAIAVVNESSIPH